MQGNISAGVVERALSNFETRRERRAGDPVQGLGAGAACRPRSVQGMTRNLAAFDSDACQRIAPVSVILSAYQYLDTVTEILRRSALAPVSEPRFS